MDDNNVSRREMALTNILERLAKHVEHYDDRLDEMEKQVKKLSAVVENLAYQIALGQDDAGSSVKKLEQDFTRYRSDMFKLAGDQSRIDSSIREIASRQATIFAAQENTVQGIANLEGRFAVQENSMQEHTKHNIKQGESLYKEMGELGARVTKHSLETQKYMMEDFKETQKLFEQARSGIVKRMTAFDELDKKLEILLTRTKPPEPKEPSAFTLAIRRAAVFVRERVRRIYGRGGSEQ